MKNSRLVVACLFICTQSIANATDVSDLSLEELLQVRIVSASKYSQKQQEVAASISVITRDEIKAYGWRNLTEAINSLPGVYSSYDRQYTYVGLRGFGLPGDYNTRELITINGNRINDTAYDQALMGNAFPLDIDLIERIEYIPGPGGAVYGQNAMLGVINVVTRKGADLNGTELAVSYQGPNNTKEGRVSWGSRLENGTDILLSVSGLKSEGQNLSHQFPDSTTGITEGKAIGLDGEHNHKFYTRVEQGPWMLDLTYMDRKKDDPVATYLSDPLTAAQFQRDRNLYAQMVYNEDLSNEKLNVLARLFYGEAHYSGQYFYSSTPFFYETTSQWLGGEVRLLSTHWDNHKMMVGLEYQDNLRQKMGGVNEIQPNDPTNYSIVKSGYRVGMYMQDEWALLDNLSSTLGIRLDNNNITGTDISPRAGLIWQANNTATVKALYGRAFRAPNTNDQYYQDSSTVTNPSLKGEQIDTLELVGERRLASDLKVSATIYQWKITNLLAWGIDPVSGLSQRQNIDDVTAHGIELSVDKTYNWGGRLRGSLSYQQSTYDKASHQLENSPNTLAKLNFMAPWHAAGVKVGYELQYNGDRRDLQGGMVNGQWLSNLNLMSDQWIKGLEVSLSLYNLFDIQYSQPAGPNNWQNTLQQDGRQVRLKAIYKF